ncbi:MAG: TetR family transcriptional regulator [Treponema sp.]|nr:TetR family transcriptional regulator [Treponema sp.]
MTNDLQSSETKLKMAQALKKLVNYKTFSKITVGDIITECGLNRNSFYYHFENMFDLLYWTYDQEIQNIVAAFQNANADYTQSFEFILSYIDQNINLCQAAYESLGENDLENMIERDLKLFLTGSVAHVTEELKVGISEDYKNFLIFNFSPMVRFQIVWYIKYNDKLDKPRFLEYIKTTFYNSLTAVIMAAGKKGL